MKRKGGPYRQCISCRRVFRKEELLRFVHQKKQEKAFFDERQHCPGRGYYLCPEQNCIMSAWKKKRGKAIFRDEVAMEHMLSAVCDALLRSVEGLSGHPTGIDTIFSKGPGHTDLNSCFVICAREEMKETNVQTLHNTSLGQRAEVFLVPRKALKGSDCLVITKKTPKILPILRNLRFYARLSSKGRAL